MTSPVAAQGRTAATREAYGPTLIKLAQAGYDVVALDADLSASTGGNKLATEFPDRWYTVGVAEATSWRVGFCW